MFVSRRITLPLMTLACLWMAAGNLVDSFLPTANAEDDLNSTALAIAPQDAAFFATSVNMRAGWTDFLEGNFVKRLKAVPFIQKLEMEFNEQWENPQGQLAQVKGVLNSPNVQNLLKLGDDMCSQEMFFYGGADWCDMIEGIMDFQNDMTSSISAGPDAMQEYFSTLEKGTIDRIRIPTTVMGFRLTDDDNARLQLDALEGILRLGGSQIEQAAPFLKKLKRSDLRDGQTLTMTLDTSLIPMDILDDEQQAVAEKVMELLEGRSLSLAIGVKSNLLLMAIGEGSTVIDSVGESPKKLIDHEAITVLQEAAPTNLRAIGYVSTRWRDSQWTANFGKYFQRLASQLSIALETEAGAMPDLETWKSQIATDAKWMDDHISDMAPKFGPAISWTRANEDGSEGFGYDWTENIALANAAPLHVINHAGKTPLMLFGFKQQDIPGVQELVEYALDHGEDHLSRFIALAERDDEERERILKILKQAWPLVVETYEIIRDKLSPSLAERESLIAVAGSWTTSSLGPNMPPPETALPLPEFAGVSKLADRDLFLAGCDELYQVFDSIVEIVRESEPDSVPIGYEVPRPEEEVVPSGTRYYYPQMSQAVPLLGFQPQLVVGEDIIVYGYSDRQVNDMLEAKPLVTRPAWMTDETPTAVVAYVDFAGMVSAARPWIAFGLSLTGLPMDQPLSDQPGPVPTGNDVLQIWDCFMSAGKSATTTTVSEDGPTVMRWVWVGE